MTNGDPSIHYIVESLNARVRWFWLTFINLSMPSLTFWRKTKHFETCSKTTKKLTIFLNIRMTVYEHNSAYLQTDCLSANCIVHCFWQNGCGCSHCCCLETANIIINRLPICTCTRMLQLLLLLIMKSKYHQQAANLQTPVMALFRYFFK